MTRDELINEYFDWMYQLVSDRRHSRNNSYRKLLSKLHNIDFTYTIDMDGNRASDGIDLRYRFGYENGYEDYIIASFLDNRPCSVLEMMVALANRCEETIMDDPEIGNRTGKWFWEMVKNLGLESMDDSNFDRDYVLQTIDIFLNRGYERNGKGGLFVIGHPKRDLRTVEIWYQMNWYLDSILNI
jgi:hypothetical protein